MEVQRTESFRWDSSVTWLNRFEPNLAGLAAEFRDPVRMLYHSLCRWDYLLARPPFFETTPSILVSGLAGNSGPDCEPRLIFEIPLLDRSTGVSLRFLLFYSAPDALFLDVWIDINGGPEHALSIELWSFCKQSGYGVSRQDALIRKSEDFDRELDRVLHTAADVLERHCATFVSGEVQPHRFEDLIDIPADDVFREMIARLIHSNVFDLSGRSLLSHAILKRRTDRLRILLECGADPCHVCPDEFRMRSVPSTQGTRNQQQCFAPLHYLARAVDLDKPVFDEMLSLLMRHRADPNQKGPGGITPLGVAADLNWFEGVKSLLKVGAKDPGWSSPRAMNAGSAIHQMLATTLGRGIFSMSRR